MQTKLTLTIEKATVEKAKQYAKQSGRSLSALIESYLESVTATEPSSTAVPSAFDGLFGSISLPTDVSDKQRVRSIVIERAEKSAR